MIFNLSLNFKVVSPTFCGTKISCRNFFQQNILNQTFIRSHFDFIKNFTIFSNQIGINYFKIEEKVICPKGSMIALYYDEHNSGLINLIEISSNQPSDYFIDDNTVLPLKFKSSNAMFEFKVTGKDFFRSSKLTQLKPYFYGGNFTQKYDYESRSTTLLNQIQINDCKITVFFCF